MELKAEWGYTITFNANGGTGKMKNAVMSDNYELPKSAFKRTGYKFVGWSTKKQADVLSFYEVGYPANAIENGKKGVTLYAQWVKPTSYKITYASVKGVKLATKEIKKYTAGKTTMLPQAILTTEDKMFAGWNITVNGKKVLGTFFEIPPYMTGNIKLTPVFSTYG